MNDHATRAHATWSASATSRNWNCPGALTLAELVKDLEVESEAAAWGTACHTVAEDCLVNGREAAEWTGRTVKTKEHEIEVDEEMAETAQTYIDYVQRRLDYVLVPPGHIIPVTGDPKDVPVLQVEQRFSLEKLNPPFDAGGTADAVIYFPAEKLLEVIDLKGGRGVKVDATENKQLRTYALGAMLANPGLEVQRVRSTIVQPRVSREPKSEEYDVSELLDWTGELMSVMGTAAAAKAEYAKVTGDLTREAWAEKFLRPGEVQCKFCPAAGFCPALKKQALDAAGVWFDDLEQPRLSNTPADLSPERLAQVLDAADMIQDYLNACRALAHRLAETGVEIPNYQIVEKVGRRRWINEEALPDALGLIGLDDDQIYDRKLKSPAGIEKVLGTKKKNLIAELVEKPVTGTNLVRADKTTREAIPPKAHQFFNIEKE